MSLAWMSRVWASERPRRSSHRLLLALADNANDAGVCWPSVATLGRKCATADRRTVLRQLDWLEREGFVGRETRPGRSTVYHLVGGALGGGPDATGGGTPTGDRAPTGQASPTRGGTPTGGGVALRPQGGDGAPTGGVALRPPEPTENTSLNPQQQQHAAREVDGAVPLRMIVSDAGSRRPAVAAATREKDGDDAVSVLVRRGVDRPVAEELAAAHGAEAVGQAVRLYDERRQSPKPPHGPGWMVAALRRGYAGESAEASPLLSHRQMLDWCEANGGLQKTAEFEPVTVEAGQVMFRREAT